MQPWWQTAVFYQIYPRSFLDTSGDGVGDLEGIRRKLDHLVWLGIDALWISPFFRSPMKDYGYDVSDYCDVDPLFGSLADFDRLLAEAHARGLRLIVDWVPNHTSDQHPWFQEARRSRAAAKRDWYIWRDGSPERPPNNWRAAFTRGPAWTWDTDTKQWYLHLFLPEQPDLNWANPEVVAAMHATLRFWLERGVDGFRMDVIHCIGKDREFRDRPESSDIGVVVDLDETFAVLRRWRSVVDAYEDPRILLGETWVMDLERLAGFYGSGEDQLHLAFNFPFALSPLETGHLRHVVESSETLLPRRGWPAWTLSNHDMARFPTRMCGGDERKVRCALLALLTLRGTPVLYYGDEIGLPQIDIPGDAVRDIGGRDGARTPMPWNDAWTDPWLPVGGGTTVAQQRNEPDSILAFTRELIARRRSSPDLVEGAYESLSAPVGVWAYRRGDSVVVALNLADEPARFDGRELAPWEGVILDA